MCGGGGGGGGGGVSEAVRWGGGCYAGFAPLKLKNAIFRALSLSVTSNHWCHTSLPGCKHGKNPCQLGYLHTKLHKEVRQWPCKNHSSSIPIFMYSQLWVDNHCGEISFYQKPHGHGLHRLLLERLYST